MNIDSGNCMMSRKRVIALLLCVISFLSVMLWGCGGITSFTGGGIPPRRSAVIGKVVQAANPLQPAPNATVTISTIPPNSSLLSYKVYTDANGAFEVNGIPTGSVTGTITIQVDPNDASLQSQHFSFLITNGRPANLVISLPSASFNLAAVSKVIVTAQGFASNGQELFKAETLDAQGAPLALFPSLFLDGGSITINPDNTFSAGQIVSGPPSAGINTMTAIIDTGSTTPPSSTVPAVTGSISTTPVVQ